jgi:hypothetical protein
MRELTQSPKSPFVFPEGETARIIPRVYGRLDREIHGFLVDMGVAVQRTDEFVPQEGMVKRFMAAWGKVAEEIEKKVIKQVEAGKEVSF